MRYFLKSRNLMRPTLVLLLSSGLLALWKGTSLYLPLPDFIPTLARSVPVDAVLIVCSVTAIALAAYPGAQLWERVAPRSIQMYSYFLATGLGLFTCFTFGIACLGDSTVWLVLMKLLGLLGVVSVLYRCLGAYVSLIPSILLVLSTIFARRSGGGLAPWAWLVNNDPQLYQVILTLVAAGMGVVLAERFHLVIDSSR
ncbi:hypothetical protein [Rothia sp. 88186D007BW]